MAKLVSSPTIRPLVSSVSIILFLLLQPSTGLYTAEVEKLHISSTVRFRYAVTTVYSRLFNPDDASREAVFDAVLPETAVISNLSLTTGGKKFVGRVEEREIALREYEKAKEDGEIGVFIRQNPRFANSYKISVNLAPGAKADFTLIYEELLVRRLGSYNLVVHLNPGQIVEDLRIQVSLDESRPLEFVDVSDIETSDLIPFKEKRKPEVANVAHVNYISPSQALITYTPSVEDQERASFDSGIGRLRVSFDVDHVSDGGEIQVGGDHFVHFFAPTNLPPMPKFVTFVLDVSGSMVQRHKLYEVKDAMRKILRDMAEGDRFSIIAFADELSVWRVEEEEEKEMEKEDEEKDATSRRRTFAASATTSNVDSAIGFVNGLGAGGATNVYDALEAALKDVYEMRNREKNSNASRPDLIFFLTDGRPTVGKFIKEEDILHQINKDNYRGDVVIHSLGFGEDVNSDFLERLSLMNGGFYRKIHVAPDASLQLTHFYREVSTPLMSNLDFHYSLPGMDDTILTSTEFHLLYDGSEVVVAGKFKTDLEDESVKSPQATIYGKSTSEKKSFSIQFPKPSTSLTFTTAHYGDNNQNFIERLWAFMLVNQMIKEHKAVENKWLSRSLKEEALKMALKYQFVTPLTAMVLTKPSSSSSSPNQILAMDDTAPYWDRDEARHYDGVKKEEEEEGEVDSEGLAFKREENRPIDNKLSEKRDLDANGGGGSGRNEFVAAASRQKLDEENAANGISLSLPLFCLAILVGLSSHDPN